MATFWWSNLDKARGVIGKKQKTIRALPGPGKASCMGGIFCGTMASGVLEGNHRLKFGRTNGIASRGRIQAPRNNEISDVQELIEEGQGWKEDRIRNLFPRVIAESILRTPY
ncbi:hypothetical protein PIB30_050464 [Stylosanthes scabra]|uniref:Uncharacterized protein n=1 Tax=Stylosanthes scabra TaxID=79078 RepID=A0ABU6VIG2_9FABA|nr:hypothetical protein [Stylosanthes scabra]